MSEYSCCGCGRDNVPENIFRPLFTHGNNPWAGMGFACGVIIKNEKNIHESFLYH